MTPPDFAPVPVPRYRPVDVLTLLYTALVFLALAIQGSHLEDRTEFMAVFLGAFLLVRIAVPVARRSRRPLLRFLAEVYPLVLLTFFYVYSNRMNTLVFPQSFDAFFRELDRRMFGGEPSFWLAHTFGSPLVHEIVHALYATYYIQIPAVALVYYFTRRAHGQYQRMIFTLCLTFYASYLVFVALPVHGPHSLRGDDYAGGWLFVPMMDFIYRTAETDGGAFPSSHVAVSLVCLLFSWRHSRGLFAAGLVSFLGITLATVYCRYHYAVDSLAGIAWGVLGYAAGVSLFDRLPAAWRGTDTA
ncbi:MAG: phosphatase PAP2 family protein [Planctomycetes bacterium]|nr:phosphatase PAP2 family protein [Planctomycetota bacterium]